MADTIQRWLDDVPDRAEFGNTDVFYRALDYGVSDPTVIDNAVALVEHAQRLYVKYDRSIPFDTIVRGLLQGIEYPHEPFWWYKRWYYRQRRRIMLFWLRVRRKG